MIKIEAEKLDPARLKELSAIMVRSNKEAIAACDKLLGNRKYQQFRAALRGEKVDSLTAEEISAIGRIGKHRKATMLEVEAIRNEVIEGFIPAMVSFAHKYASVHHDADDIFGEISIIMVKVIYGYSKPKSKFITYFYATLCKELRRYLLSNRTNGLTSKSIYFIELLHMSNQAMAHIASEGKRPDYYSILEYLKPRYKKNKQLKRITRLEDYLPGVLGFVETVGIQDDGQNAGLDCNDYASGTADHSSLLDKKLLQAEWSDTTPEQFVANVPLSIQENNVLQLKMTGRTNKEIATTLKISARKVSTHLTSARNAVSQYHGLPAAA